MSKVFGVLILVWLSGCFGANICSGNTINDQVDPPNDEDNVICGVSVNE